MLKTLDVLPQVDDRVRFGAVNIGYDKVMMIRQEFTALQALAAVTCQCPVADLTIAQIQARTAELEEPATTKG